MSKDVIYKISIILLIFIIAVFFISNTVFAKINTDIQIGYKLRNEATTIGNRVIGALKVVGSFVAVIMIMVVGIKYMISSVEEKAEYKKTATYYLIGAVLTFATVNIVSYIYDFMN